MHLQDAVFALHVRDEVEHLDVVRVVREVAAHVLLHLVLPARGIHVVAARVARVDRTTGPRIGGAAERIIVEALLRHHAIGVV